MSTVIYLSNRQIQVVVGSNSGNSISVKQYFTVTPPEGSIINGMVMDVGMFSSFMSSFWNQNSLPKKDVILVINSSKFIGKTLQVPMMKDSKTYPFIEREYADMGREEMIFSYIHTETLEGKNQKVYSEGIESDFIGDYVSIFSDMGITLSAVYSGESSLITFIGQTAAKQERTFVLLIADSMTLTTVLWVNGAFYYYNSTRCFHEQGTEEYADDIARTLSQLSQFMQANRIDHHLSSIQLAGVSYEDKGLYMQAIADMGIETPIHIFNFKTGGGSVVDPNIQNYLLAVCGLYVKEKTANFLPRFYQREKQTKDEGKTQRTKTILIIAATLFVMIFIMIVLFGVELQRKFTLKKLNEYNEDPAVMMEVARNTVLVERNSYLLGMQEAIGEIDYNLYTYPLGNEDIQKVFEECAMGYAEIEYRSFNAEEGTIVISAKASKVEDINKFIRNLTQKATFCIVDYTGYVFDESSKMWDIQVICTLSPSAGRDPSNAPKRSEEVNEDEQADEEF
ncbi:MAG: hypothetical protein PUE21_01930 [Lachnospiraceae bacterium]|nr:hypothetical protein [Lachnospiraceae bacterium]